MQKFKHLTNSAETLFLFDFEIFETYVYADLVIAMEVDETAAFKVDDTWYVVVMPRDAFQKTSAVMLKCILPLRQVIPPKTKTPD